MKNQSFSYSNLARCFIDDDFYHDSRLSDDTYRGQVVERALNTAETLFGSGISLEQTRISGKAAYRVTTLSEKLVLRLCNEHLRYAICHPHKHRNDIAREISTFLREGTQYRVYRLDIRNFFESIQLSCLRHLLQQHSSIGSHAARLLLTHTSLFQSLFGPGLPRGVETSPMLADLLLSKFDRAAVRQQGVLYYTRFVDDIFIMTTGNERHQDFHTHLEDNLPTGLHFNTEKTLTARADNQSVTLTHPEGDRKLQVSFLGYQYTVFDIASSKKQSLASFRYVDVDISPDKVRKIKTRIAQSFSAYLKNRDYDLLFDRLAFLTSNRYVKSKRDSRPISAGIYYNYAAIGSRSQALRELDKFTRCFILGLHGRLGKALRGSLTSGQRQSLTNLRFVTGFQMRIRRKFSPSRLHEIARIWR